MTCSYAKEFSTAGFTDIENAFICEYLPVSSGDAVKVYLYGLFLCQNPKLDQSISEIASTLNMSEQEILNCFEYWEDFGLIQILSKDPYTVQYQPIHTSISGKPKKIKAEKYTEFSKSIQAILPDRMISTNEYTEYFSIMETYSIKPDAMLMIVKYCAVRKGTDIGYRYISKVAKDFGSRGLNTVEKVEKELSSYTLRTGFIERILKSMGLRRQPEIEDITYLNKWTNELNFEEENIVFAASKLKKGSIAKLDEFLMELYSMKSFSKSEIALFMDRKKEVYDLTIKINKALSVYVEVIDTVVDNYTNKWLSYGFDEQTLLFIANHCFKTEKNTLRDMDELLEQLRNKGFIDLSSINDYFTQIHKDNEFLSKMLITAGVNRRPTPWDRENLAMWHSWNFDDEMILKAASLSAGKSQPTAYMNGILSNWKNNQVFTVNDIDKTENSSSYQSQEEYNREYANRRTKAVSKAQKNLEKATAIDGFMALYGKLNGMEKDLAFAEISGNKDALIEIENKQKDITDKLSKLLATIDLTIEDLSPNYACKKCNDTGYVGTHRCDCL